MYLAAVALAAASPAPVEVVSREVVLSRHDRAPIEVRCNRTRRRCRGVLVLGIQQCDHHPSIPDCQLPLGHRRFAIPPQRSRRVVVARTTVEEFRADGPEEVVVAATPYLRRPTPASTTRWTRRVRLVAPDALPRPELAPELRAVQRLVKNGPALRFEAAGARATTSMSVELVGHDVSLHREMYWPHVLGQFGFAVAGAAWHGELPVEEDRYRAGERYPYRLRWCSASTCGEERGEVTIEPDPALIPRPICALRPI